MKIKIFLFLVIGLVTINLQAQNENKLNLSLGYFGEFMFRQGLKIGASSSILNNHKIKSEKLTRIHSLPVGGNFIVYNHKKNHKGFLINLESGYQFSSFKTKDSKQFSKFSLQLLFGLGYYHYFLTGDVYVLDQGIELKKVRGGNAFMPSFGIELGSRLTKNFPLNWYTKFNCNVQLPLGTSVLVKPSLELGVHYQIQLKQKNAN